MSLIYFQDNKNMSKRLIATARASEITLTALRLSETSGYQCVTRQQIAEAIGITPQAVQHHIGTVIKMRRDIMRAAIRDENLQVLAQGLAMKDPHALKACDTLKAKARAAL